MPQLLQLAQVLPHTWDSKYISKGQLDSFLLFIEVVRGGS